MLDTNISLKTGTKNIRRSSPTRDQNSPLETEVENPNQDANLAAGFAILTTILNKLNLINMPSPTKDYIVRKATSLQNNDKRHSTTTTPATGNHRKIILENSRTKRGDVLDLQELEAVLEHMKTLQTMRESLREQQFQAILELGVESQDILQEITKLHNADPLPKEDLATPVESVANPMTGRKKMKAKYYPKLSPPQLDPQSRNAPRPTPQPQPAQTDKAWHPHTSETLTPRRGAFDCVWSADSAPTKTDQIRPPITSANPTRRAAFDFVRSAYSAPAKTDQIRPTTTSKILTPRRDAFDFGETNSMEAQTVPARTPRKDSTAPQWKKSVTAHSDCTLDTPREYDEPALVEAHVTERRRPQGVDIITFESNPDSDIDEFHRKWRAKYATEAPVFSYESDPICSDRSCGREGSTLNRMIPVQMRLSRVQPKAVDCVSDAATNSYLRQRQQAKPATECSMFSYKSDSSCPNCDQDSDIDEIRREWQARAADNMDRYVLNSDYSAEYCSDDEYSRDLYRHYVLSSWHQ
jgi:hypothetical protein